ncbi:MAG: hypothetical protein R2726_20835 [Acidimicrobiales bacterium]
MSTTSPSPTSPFEDRLRDALAVETSGVDDAPAVWEAIRTAAGTVPISVDEGRRARTGSTGDGRHRGRAALLAVAASVAVALIVAGIAVARRDTGRDVYIGPATTDGPATTAVTIPAEPSPPTSELGRALWATAALRAALEDEQLATVAARYGLRPDAELRLVDARAATDAAAAFAEQALPRLGDGDTELAARQGWCPGCATSPSSARPPPRSVATPPRSSASTT